MKNVSVIIAAGGSGKRMGGKVNKPYLEIYGTPIIMYSIAVFYTMPQVKEIIIVRRKQDKKICLELVSAKGKKKIKFVDGGKERQDSVFNGLKAVKNKGIVLIHDAARPFISKEFVNKLIKECEKYKAVVPVLPISETVKRSENGKFVDATLNRKILYTAQTPQAFDFNLLMHSYKTAYKQGFYGTDDAMLVEKHGFPVRMMLGEKKNIKITTKEDL